MGKLVSEITALGITQIGYAESPLGSNRTKYGVLWDTPKSKGGPYPFFNGKKNGECGWCCLYVLWEIAMVLIGQLGWTYDQIRVWLGMPKNPADNCGAGAPWLYKYFKAKGWEVDKKKGQAGDIIFFNTSLGPCTHVGRIDSVSNGKYTTVEGNKSNKVGYGSYAIGSSSIYAVIHIPYETIEPKPEPEPEPLPHPTPEPVDPVESNLYKVANIKTFLAIRTKPSANGKKVGELYNDAIVSVLDQQDGWGKITGDLWVYMGYLKKI